MTLLRDASWSALVAGFITVLVGFSSSAVIVFQAARALDASPAQQASWMWALGVGIGLTGLVLSLRYKVPVVTAWSTPGAAMLITAAAGVTMSEAVGAFMVSALLICVCGFAGWFERMMNRIPVTLASAMLAGVLLRFGLDLFRAMQTELVMAGAMLLAYLLGRRLAPRQAVIWALLVGVGIAWGGGRLALDGIHLALATPVFTRPQFSPGAVLGVALPLFVVTMASQNIPGVSALRACGYSPPVSPLVGWTGLANLLLAPFGGFALNLAAITAAICMGPDAHEDPARRYVAAVWAGLIYLAIGLMGATVAAVFAAFPPQLVAAIAGLALLGTIGGGLLNALSVEADREAALITFLVTASGLTLAGIGAAFWGLMAGITTLLVLRTPMNLTEH